MLNKENLNSYDASSVVHAMHNLSYAHVLESVLNSEDAREEDGKRVRIGVLALQGAFSEHCVALHKCGAIPVEIRKVDDLENLQGLILPGGESSVMVKLLCEEGLLEPLRALCACGIPILATCAGLILLAKEIQSHPEQAGLGLMDIVVERNAFGRQKESFIADIPIKKPVRIQDSFRECSPTMQDSVKECSPTMQDSVKECSPAMQDSFRECTSTMQSSVIECSPAMQDSLRQYNYLEKTVKMGQDIQTESYVFPAVFIRAPQIVSSKNNVEILAKKDDKILAVQQNNMVACSFHPELSSDLLFHTWLVNEAEKI